MSLFLDDRDIVYIEIHQFKYLKRHYVCSLLRSRFLCRYATLLIVYVIFLPFGCHITPAMTTVLEIQREHYLHCSLTLNFLFKHA